MRIKKNELWHRNKDRISSYKIWNKFQYSYLFYEEGIMEGTVKSFTIYPEYHELISLLSEEEQATLYLAIAKYMFEDIEIELNDKQKKIFNNLKRPLNKSKKRSKSGSITKENKEQKQNKIKKKSNKNQKEIKSKTHQDVNVYVNVINNFNPISVYGLSFLSSLYFNHSLIFFINSSLSLYLKLLITLT